MSDNGQKTDQSHTKNTNATPRIADALESLGGSVDGVTGEVERAGYDIQRIADALELLALDRALGEGRPDPVALDAYKRALARVVKNVPRAPEK